MRRKEKDSKTKELRRNTEFIDSQSGECYVIGNGPSLNRVNLAALKDQFVITCNLFPRVSGYENVNSNAHVVVDSIFFDNRQDAKYGNTELNAIWKDICKVKSPIFVPLSGREYIVSNRIDQEADIHYLDILTNEIPDRTGNKLKIDITKSINSYVNVVQFSIVLAINYGFKKIGLVGCDTTGIIGLINAAYDNDDMEYHAYSGKSDGSKKLLSEIVNNNGLADVLYWESFNFLGFKRLHDLCKEQGIELLNYTDKTLLDSVPKIEKKELYSKDTASL